MEFTATKLNGAFLVRLKKIEDNRGYFARGWCRDEFTKHGLNPGMLQLNVAFSHRKGTLRGLHFQEKPHEEAKFVRCTRGAIYDVIVDLRPDSPTCGQWIGTELTADNGVMVYAPEGFAHGYQTLTDSAEMYYMTSEVYVPHAAKGILYSDPELGIEWPLPVEVISEQDRKWPHYRVHALPGASK
jgi:dTDP-4-dehydrorhamnose 3,5-epimerase